jgi:hypothetical protein
MEGKAIDHRHRHSAMVVPSAPVLPPGGSDKRRIIMAYPLLRERPGSAALSPRGLFGALRAWLRARHEARRRRAYIESLLGFDDTRLHDIGLRRTDLFDALQSDSRAGYTLAQRRSANSRASLGG